MTSVGMKDIHDKLDKVSEIKVGLLRLIDEWQGLPNLPKALYQEHLRVGASEFHAGADLEINKRRRVALGELLREAMASALDWERVIDETVRAIKRTAARQEAGVGFKVN